MSANGRWSLSDAHEYWLHAAEPRLSALCNSRKDLPAFELQARCQALAAESAAIRSFLWKFDTSFNELQPVSRLPAELLTCIFSIVEAACPVGNDKREEARSATFRLATARAARNKYVDWLSVTRVCRQWRNDALACSSLWSRIPLSMNPKSVNAFLARSGNASLIIECEFRDGTSNLMKVMQPTHMVRARKIYLPNTALNSVESLVLAMLANPAPRLEVLSFFHGFVHLRRTSSIRLPDNLLNNEAPRLRVFDVQQLNRWPVYPALFANLRVFSVTNDGVASYVFPPLSEMCQVFQSMPLLETLRLHNSMTRGYDSSNDEGLIALPLLRLLELSGPVAACSTVLHILRVTVGCKVFLACADEVTIIRRLAPALIDDLHGTGFNVNFAPESLAVALTDGNLQITAFQESMQNPRVFQNCERVKPPVPCTTVFSFSLTPSHRSERRNLKLMVELVQRLCARALPVDAITSASISTAALSDHPARTVYEPLWTAALAPCSRLERLHVYGSAAYVLLRKLAEAEPEVVLFPALNLFIFDESHISRVRMFENVSLYHILLAALERRTIESVQMPEPPPLVLVDADMDALRALTNLRTYSRIRGRPVAAETFFESEDGEDDVSVLDFTEAELATAEQFLHVP